ncbi:KH domain-containing protein [Helicobacter bizzozeronii]|uniref:KH domain-containing protein n=1 Tax=Helicobacter bizzozeronii TaxID=56877 RepID=UPI000CEEC64C|nr:KH domain-containing protein [Helicobacter bizzozeronii]
MPEQESKAEGENLEGGFCVEKFVQEYCKKIVTYPQVLEVKSKMLEEGTKELCIYTNPVDMGRVIGKDGKMVSAIKAFISGVKAKNGLNYKIVVLASENPYVL